MSTESKEINNNSTKYIFGMVRLYVRVCHFRCTCVQIDDLANNRCGKTSTLCLLVASADNLCKDQAQRFVMVFMKNISKKLILKNSSDDKKA